MELKVINKKEEPLLSRIKVEAEIAFEKATPSRAEIKSQVAKDVGKDEKLVVVKSIYTTYGLKKAKTVYEVPVTYRGHGYAEGKKIRAADTFSGIGAIIRFRWFA